MKKKKAFINWMGIGGPLGFVSYMLAMFLSPLAYPNYDWMSQAVSDLSASSAPSRVLWNEIASIYNVMSVLIPALAIVAIGKKYNRWLRLGIYLYFAMSIISTAGYGAFPLSESGVSGSFADLMHLVVTVFVVALSVLSLFFVAFGGLKARGSRFLGIVSLVLFGFLLTAPISMAVPTAYFGIVQRLSNISITFFLGVIGVFLFMDFPEKDLPARSGELTEAISRQS